MRPSLERVERIDPHVRIEVDRPVGRILLDRDDKHNAVSVPMLQAMSAAVGGMAVDDGIRAIVLAGEGRSFCAGEDVRGFGFPDHDRARAFLDDPLDLFAALETVPKPIIAAVHGHAYGFGSEVLLAADVVFASPDARFGFAEIDHGAVPSVLVTRGFGVTFRRRALYLALTGDRIDARQARANRLVHEVVDEPRGAAEELARTFAAYAPAAIAMVKRRLGARAWDDHATGKDVMPAVLTNVRPAL